MSGMRRVLSGADDLAVIIDTGGMDERPTGLGINEVVEQVYHPTAVQKGVGGAEGATDVPCDLSFVVNRERHQIGKRTAEVSEIGHDGLAMKEAAKASGG